MIQLLPTSCNYIVWMWKWNNSGCWCGHGREASASVVPQHDFNLNQIPREFTRRQGMWSIVNPWLATKWWRQLKDSDGWSNTTHDQCCFSIGSRFWTILWRYPFCEQRIEWDGISCSCQDLWVLLRRLSSPWRGHFTARDSLHWQIAPGTLQC